MRTGFRYAAIGMLICLGSVGAEAAQRSAPATLNRIREMKTAVVQIGFTSDAPQPGIPLQGYSFPQRAGTGFFVNKQRYVLTAGHARPSAMDVSEFSYGMMSLAQPFGAAMLRSAAGIPIGLSKTRKDSM
jgi:hypothetical protein